MNPSDPVTESGSLFAAALTDTERQMRDRFVDQYLDDYDPVAALTRCGYAQQYAKDYAARFMREPYTLNRIKERQLELGVKTDEDLHRRKIIAILYREANNMTSAGSARVGAATQLSKILGIEAPVKTQQVLPKIGQTDLSKLTDAELEQLEKILGKTASDASAAQPS